MNRLLQLAVGVAGIFCLAASVRCHWWLLPADSAPRPATNHSASDDGRAADLSFAVAAARPRSLPYFLVGTLATALLATVTLATARWRRTTVVLASCWGAVLLAFPYAAMILEPELGARAAWLQSQLENLTWLGGDLATGFESALQPDQPATAIVYTPRRFAIVPMPTWALSDVSPTQFFALVEWLGYTDAFCAFVRRGWFLACIGTAAVCLSVCVGSGKPCFAYLNIGRRMFGGVLGVGIACAWILPLNSSKHLSCAASRATSGDYQEAVVELRRAASILPALAHDSYYVAQLGLLETLTGEVATPAAQLHRAVRMERAGRLEQARSVYRTLVRDLPRESPIRREACRATLRSAISAFNSGSYQRATDGFRTVLAAEPCNLKAMYSLSLSALRRHDWAQLENLVRRQDAVYAFFQFHSKKSVLASNQRLLFRAALAESNADAATRIHPRLRRP